MTTRAERVREAQRLRAEGLLLREIAERMDSKISTVHEWLADPDLSRHRARREAYAGVCGDCGKPTDGSYGPGKAAERCLRCNGLHQGKANVVWTPEKIIAAIREWAAEHGEPPAAADWAPAKARSMGDGARAQRFEAADGQWPTHGTVFRGFGSWNAAIEAAGYGPRLAGGGGGNGARHRSVRKGLAT